MFDYIDKLINESPLDNMKGTSAAATANHLLMSILIVSKRMQPDFLLAVSFLTKRVLHPDTDDWKKLGHCLRYLSICLSCLPQMKLAS
jgi:hypothetical protein